MQTEDFVEKLQLGIQDLGNQLAIVEAQIKEFKAKRKTLRTQIASNHGALAAVHELNKIVEEEMRDLKNDI